MSAQLNEFDRVIRMHDFVETNGPIPRTLERGRQPNKEELFTQLLNAAENLLSASGRRSKRTAEDELLRTVDRIRLRLGIGSANEWKRQGRKLKSNGGTGR